jgi:hypothetical protein
MQSSALTASPTDTGSPRRNIVFQNAQRFVEIADDEIDESRTQTLAKAIGIRIDAQRSGSGDACRDDCGDPVGVPYGAEQKLSAQSVVELFTGHAGNGEVSIVNARQFRNGKHRRSYSAMPYGRVT